MRRRLLLAALIIVVALISTFLIYRTLTSPRDVMIWDFHPIWLAGRWIVEGRGSPYSEDMTREIQLHSYGRPAEPDEDPHTFAYPLYVLALMLPVILLPLPWAQALWLTMLLFGVVVGIVASMKFTEWKPNPSMTTFTILWAFFLYPIAWALALGQVSILIFAMIAVALEALRLEKDGWAGACLALATAKPQMSFLITPALIIWAIARRRYRFLITFIGGMIVLLAASFIALPTWPQELIQSMQTYLTQRPFYPPATILGNALFGQGAGFLTALPTLFLLTGTVWVWWHGRDITQPPTYAIAVTLTVTTLIAPRTSTVNQVLLLLPFCLLFAGLLKGNRWRHIAILAIQIALLVVPWTAEAVIRSLPDDLRRLIQHRTISTILPVLTIAALATHAWRVKLTRKNEK